MIPFRKVSKEALINWEIAPSEEVAEQWIAELSIDELDEKVDAKYSMEKAIDGIVNYLQQEGVELTAEEVEQYKHAVFHGPEDAEIFSIIREKFSQIKDPDSLILASLTNVHDGWVQKFPNKFFAREKKHQHLPTELIGWEEAKNDLLFLKPILEASGIKVNEERLKATYYDAVKKFFVSRGIESEADIAAKIPEIANSYFALEGQTEILEKLNDPAFVRNVLMPQIKSKGIGSDLTFIVEATKSAVTKDGLDSASTELRENYQEFKGQSSPEILDDGSTKAYTDEPSTPTTEDDYFGAGPHAYAVQKLYGPDRENTPPEYDADILDDNKSKNGTDEPNNPPTGLEEEYDGQITDNDDAR